jgi:hypothetical protein
MTTYMTTIATESLRDTLQEAQESLNQAIRLLEIYCRETNDRNAQAYLVDHLKIFAGRDHGFLSSDLNIDDLIDRLDENEPDDDIDLANLAVDTDFRDSRGRYWVKSLQQWVAMPNEG